MGGANVVATARRLVFPRMGSRFTEIDQVDASWIMGGMGVSSNIIF